MWHGFEGPHGPQGAAEGDERGRGRRGPRGRGFGRPGGWQNVDLPSAEDAAAWFEGRLPADWFSAVSVQVDREEITVIGTLAEEAGPDRATAEGRSAGSAPRRDRPGSRSPRRRRPATAARSPG